MTRRKLLLQCVCRPSHNSREYEMKGCRLGIFITLDIRVPYQRFWKSCIKNLLTHTSAHKHIYVRRPNLLFEIGEPYSITSIRNLTISFSINNHQNSVTFLPPLFKKKRKCTKITFFTSYLIKYTYSMLDGRPVSIPFRFL